jgi:hypothetical protein
VKVRSYIKPVYFATGFVRAPKATALEPGLRPLIKKVFSPGFDLGQNIFRTSLKTG